MGAGAWGHLLKAYERLLLPEECQCEKQGQLEEGVPGQFMLNTRCLLPKTEEKLGWRRRRQGWVREGSRPGNRRREGRSHTWVVFQLLRVPHELDSRFPGKTEERRSGGKSSSPRFYGPDT